MRWENLMKTILGNHSKSLFLGLKIIPSVFVVDTDSYK